VRLLQYLITLIVLFGAVQPSGRAQSAASQSAVDQQLLQADDLQEKGKLREARTIYESVLKTLPSDQPTGQLGHLLNGLSHLSTSEGNYKDALDLARRADDVYRKLGNAAGRGYALNNQGIAEEELGQYSQAQESLRQALGFCRQAGDAETEVRTQNNLGGVYFFTGQYLEGQQAYQAAQKILRSRSGESWVDYWKQITSINEATLYQRLGRNQRALEIYQQVQASSKAISAGDRAHLLTNLGVLYRRLGDPYKAIDSYQRAVDLYSHQHDFDGEISTLKNLGIVYALDLGDLVRARKYFERALALATRAGDLREVVQAHLYLGETNLREKKLTAARQEFGAALAQAKQLGIQDEQWKALYGLGQLGELEEKRDEAESAYREVVSIIETTRSQLQLSALRAEFLADKRSAYDALISLLVNKKDVESAFLFLERSRARTFQDRLVASSGDGKSAAVTPGVGETQQHLSPGAILLEFWVAEDRIALIWCTRNASGMEQTQLSAEDKQQIMELLRALPAGFDADWRNRWAVLRAVLPPAFSMPAGVEHVLIVPDGWLSAVPFDLVPVAANSPQLLIEQCDVSYLPTAAVLARPYQPRPSVRWPWSQELIAFGDPIGPGESAQLGPATRGGSESLPYSTEEIRSIAAMTRGKATLHLREEDLKRSFLAASGRATPILHLSTHALADAEVPENSRILFSQESPGQPTESLFLRELYDLDLRGTELATLSACDTERGAVIRGEGTQGFSRALMAAGTRTSVTTLWRVSDQPASEFMKQFYYLSLRKYVPTAQALRQAKLKFLRSGSELANPAHWAGFVLTGDGTSPLPKFVSWDEVAFAGLSLGLGLAWALRYLLRRQKRAA